MSSRAKISSAVHSPTSTPDAIIAVVGSSSSGKSSFIAAASNTKIGDSQARNKIRVVRYVEAGRIVELVDTPSFNDTEISDTEVYENLLDWLETSYGIGQKLSGLIYTHRIVDESPMWGLGAKNFKLFGELLGTQNLGNATLCTTWWDEASETTGESNQKELASSFWKPLINKGASIHRHDRTQSSAGQIIKPFLKLEPDPNAEEISALKSQVLALEAEAKLLRSELSLVAAERAADARMIREQLQAIVQQNQDEINDFKRETLDEMRRFKEELHNNLRESSAAMLRSVREETEGMVRKADFEASMAGVTTRHELADQARRRDIAGLNGKLLGWDGKWSDCEADLAYARNIRLAGQSEQMRQLEQQRAMQELSTGLNSQEGCKQQ